MADIKPGTVPGKTKVTVYLEDWLVARLDMIKEKGLGYNKSVFVQEKIMEATGWQRPLRKKK